MLSARRRLHTAVRPAAALLPIVLLIAAVAGCGGGTTSSGGGGVDVVATTTVLGDIAREVGGDAAAVTQLLQPNSDPHDYEPRPDDVKAVAGAAVVLESGDGLDHWIDDVVEQSGGSPDVVDVGAQVPVRRAGGESHDHGADDAHGDDDHGDDHGAEGHGDDDHGEASGDDHDHGDVDPHWWHDPRNVEAAANAVRDALTRADPDARAAYARNAAAYVRKVRALDAGIRACFDAVPPADRKLVTDHDAFGYFADRYGIDVVGAVIPSLTTQAQPSAGDLAQLSRLIERERVKAIFPETSVSKKLADALAKQTGATSEHVLYGDTLGPEGSDGATYLAMERHNADAMVRGFTGGARGCEIPAS